MSSSAKRARLSMKRAPSWFDFPGKVRETIIDKMDAKARCIFTKCSKVCEIEGKASKNYVKMIRIDRNTHPELHIGHYEEGYNYCLEFIDVRDLSEVKSIVVYKTVSDIHTNVEKKVLPRIIKWTKLESGKAEDVRMRYLDQFLEKYKDLITGFAVEDQSFPLEKYNIKHLKNLEYIKGDILTDFLGKGFIDFSQIVKAAHVDLQSTKLTFNQVLQFKGAVLKIKSDEFSEENILKYLKMWRNGELNTNMKIIGVRTGEPRKFDGRNIINGLRVSNFQQDNDDCYFSFRFNYDRNEKCLNEVTYSSEHFFVKVECGR